MQNGTVLQVVDTEPAQKETFDLGKEILRTILNCQNKASPTAIYNCLNEHTKNLAVPVTLVSRALGDLENRKFISKPPGLNRNNIKYSLTDAGRKHLRS